MPSSLSRFHFVERCRIADVSILRNPSGAAVSPLSCHRNCNKVGSKHYLGRIALPSGLGYAWRPTRRAPTGTTLA